MNSRKIPSNPADNDLEDFNTVNQSTSKKFHDLDEAQINEDKTSKRYASMMAELELASKQKEQERIKSAKLNKVASHQNGQHEPKMGENLPSENQPKKNVLKAPNELLEEFLVYVMEKKWKDAQKLCGFILMYEPNNTIAKEFMPLIERKVIAIESDESDSDNEAGNSSNSSSDESDSTEDDDDDDSTDDSGSSGSEDDEKNKKASHNNDCDIPEMTSLQISGNKNDAPECKPKKKKIASVGGSMANGLHKK